jgi:hypothetical protein
MAGTATLAIVVGSAALLWHLLACTESPMAYSPNGRDLAFVTMEPYGDPPQVNQAGQHVFRLMVLSDGRQLRTLEETTACMLSAPAYSPDGKHLCYLRIPLLTKDGTDPVPESAKSQAPAVNSLEGHPSTETPSGTPAAGPGTQPAASDEAVDTALPRLQTILDCQKQAKLLPKLSATLVVREAEKGGIISGTPLQLPVLHDLLHDKDSLLITYLTARPQYSPDGHWVYLSAGNIVVAINPVSAEQRIVAAPAPISSLSPDGKTVAFLQEGAIGFASTDGETTVYKKWSRPPSYAGLTWVDKQTLVVLEPGKDADAKIVLHFFDAAGTLRKSVQTQLPEHGGGKDENTGQLAAAPNGKGLVLAYENDVFFMKPDGKLLTHWHKDHEQMAQPTFSPDGQRVAFKIMQDKSNEYMRAVAIAFFTLDGAELSRVPIPKIAPAATQPTAQSPAQPQAAND